MIARTDHLTMDASAAASGHMRTPSSFPRTDEKAVREARILIIDDEIGVALIQQKHLKDVGFNNLRTLTEAGRAFAEIQETRPDLILLDLNMPEVNGLEILEMVRNDDYLHHIPIVVLTQATDNETRLSAYNLGASDFLQKPVIAAELVARVRNTLNAKIYRDRVIDYTLQLESDVLHDALTSIPNRRAFDYELKRRMSEWRRRQAPLALMMVDIDHFKEFNDRFGHGAGDSALRKVAATLKSAMREMDLVARFGGEEFAVIMPAVDGPAAIDACLEAKSRVAASEIEVGGQRIPLTVSVGLALVGSADDANLLVRRADTALYAAKQAGRDCCYLHNGGHCVRLGNNEQQPGQAATERRYPAVRPDSDIRSSTIAIVDDEPATIAIAAKYLKDDGFCSCLPITRSQDALRTIGTRKPDIVLLDLHMPSVSGFEILQRMRSDDYLKSTPVVVLTASREKEDKVRALTLGATDYLEKPIQPRELLARVRNTLLAKAHLEMLKEYSSRLEYEVQLRTTELMASRREAVQCLARAAELRDDVTGRHVIRVGRYAAIIAAELGFSEDRINWMEHAAQLHDVGKIGVPDSILHKPGKLTDEEFRIMQAHCVAGRSIIRDKVISDADVLHRNVFEDWTSPMMHLASVVAATHHERWDGSGYPQGLKGTEIPVEGRITAVADVFDALSTRRPYKEAMPLDDCFRLMETKRGSHFDPDVLDAFLRQRSEITQVAIDFADPAQ